MMSYKTYTHPIVISTFVHIECSLDEILGPQTRFSKFEKSNVLNRLFPSAKHKNVNEI